MNFGERLKKLRKNKNLTQKELAVKVNVSPQVISNWERNYTDPDHDDISRLSNVLETTTDYLLGKTDVNLYDWIPFEGNKEKSNETTAFSEKDERDIAKRMEQIRKDLSSEDGLTFNGEPMSEEAIESFLEAMEYAIRQTQRVNKKYIPKKYRDKENE